MRRPEPDRQQIDELIRTEHKRLPALKQAVEDAEQANDLQAYRIAKIKYDDCLEEIIHLENKLNPYSTKHTLTVSPDAKSRLINECGLSEHDFTYRCTVCGEADNSDVACRNGCGFGDTMVADSEGKE